ncbi:hypothetical protein NPIL_397151, partial [Nephila pilipes]
FQNTISFRFQYYPHPSATTSQPIGNLPHPPLLFYPRPLPPTPLIQKALGSKRTPPPTPSLNYQSDASFVLPSKSISLTDAMFVCSACSDPVACQPLSTIIPFIYP